MISRQGFSYLLPSIDEYLLRNSRFSAEGNSSAVEFCNSWNVDRYLRNSFALILFKRKMNSWKRKWHSFVQKNRYYHTIDNNWLYWVYKWDNFPLLEKSITKTEGWKVKLSALLRFEIFQKFFRQIQKTYNSHLDEFTREYSQPK